MSKEIINELNSGTVHITEDVIISIATVETNNVEGVYEIPINMVERLSNRYMNKDVEVNIDDQNVYITIKTAIEYGRDLILIGESIQEKVRDKIESMTGLNVMEVNVVVTNVVIPKEPKESN